MTKTTLLAAASAVVMAVAGGAQAGDISAVINGVTVAGGPASSRTFYTIASERTDASTTTAANGAVFTNTLTTAQVVGAGSEQTYRVTFNLTNATIGSGATLQINGAAPGAGVSVTAAGNTGTSATFIVSVTGQAGGTTVSSFSLVSTLTSPSELDVQVGSTVELLAGGVATTVDTAAATTVIRYRPVLGTFRATSNNTRAALPNFQTFTNTGVTTNPAPLNPAGTTAELASNFMLMNDIAGNAGGTFRADLSTAGAAGVVTPASIINTGTVVIAGPQLGSSQLTPALSSGGTLGARAATASSVTFTLDATQANAFVGGSASFTVSQNATPIQIVGGSYQATFTPTYETGFSGPASFSTAAGNIGLDGVNFVAPWFSGSQSPNQAVLRMTNNSGSAIGPVTLRLRNALARPAAGGAPAAIADQTCTTNFTVPATGDLQIGNNEITACFGAFLRGDVLITVANSGTNLTAKARVVNSGGGISEITLGRFSGGTAADAASGQ